MPYFDITIKATITKTLLIEADTEDEAVTDAHSEFTVVCDGLNEHYSEDFLYAGKVDPTEAICREFAALFTRFKVDNADRISKTVEGIDADKFAGHIEEIHMDLASDIKGYLGAKAANATPDPKEQEIAISRAEEWVTDNISNTGSLDDTVALILYFHQNTDALKPVLGDVVATPVLTGDDPSLQLQVFTDVEKAILTHYAAGDYADLLKSQTRAQFDEDLRACGDELLMYLIEEVGLKEKCNPDEAMRRIQSIIGQLHEVNDEIDKLESA